MDESVIKALYERWTIVMAEQKGLEAACRDELERLVRVRINEVKDEDGVFGIRHPEGVTNYKVAEIWSTTTYLHEKPKVSLRVHPRLPSGRWSKKTAWYSWDEPAVPKWIVQPVT